MDQKIAFCGLDCVKCEGFLATQANDQAAKERVAAKWQKEFNAPGITAAFVTCDGCRAFDGRLGGHCTECEIRACGVARKLVNCAYCPEYATCEKLAGFLKFVPDARVTLDQIQKTI